MTTTARLRRCMGEEFCQQRQSRRRRRRRRGAKRKTTFSIAFVLLLFSVPDASVGRSVVHSFCSSDEKRLKFRSFLCPLFLAVEKQEEDGKKCICRSVLSHVTSCSTRVEREKGFASDDQRGKQNEGIRSNEESSSFSLVKRTNEQTSEREKWHR